MKIAVVTPVFSFAGVPLAQVRFARALVKYAEHVDLVIGHIDPAYEFPSAPGVSVIELKKKRVRDMFGAICSYLRQARPDVIFVAEDHLSAIVLAAAIFTRSRARISCSSRVTPFDTYSKVPFSKRWWLKQIVRIVMWRANALTCVSEDMVAQYRQTFRNARHVCVYNIVDDAASRERLKGTVEDAWFLPNSLPVVIAAGRLAPWKGFADLVRAVRIVSDQVPVRLLILGDGELRDDLLALVAELGLDGAVRLPGYEANPLKYFARSDVFVLSSTVEGLPNVLVEAMMCGCTPVATDCPTGPREVLKDGRYGWLVPVGDIDAMAAAILRALESPVPAAELQKAVLPFQESAVLKRHFELLGLRSA